jgi:hypothetical protein
MRTALTYGIASLGRGCDEGKESAVVALAVFAPAPDGKLARIDFDEIEVKAKLADVLELMFAASLPIVECEAEALWVIHCGPDFVEMFGVPETAERDAFPFAHVTPDVTVSTVRALRTTDEHWKQKAASVAGLVASGAACEALWLSARRA